MDLDLDRVLANTRAGQWSVDDFDWSRPLEGADHLGRRERREAGLALAFTAGLERQAARVFGLCATYADDPRAREIYRLFARDEDRHAAAELALARRYGVTWDDQPITVRWMFRTLAGNFEPPTRGVHELSAASILLFELALDSILIPALKQRVADPLQAEVFRRIDLDESRHLAMDYWLLDRKGAEAGGRTLRELLEAEQGRAPLPARLAGKLRLWRAMAALLVGFATNGLTIRSLRRELTDPAKIRRYLKRVSQVPNKAPRALDAPAYRMGLRGQQMILRLMGRLTGSQEPARG
jgi:hypothetical protein